MKLSRIASSSLLKRNVIHFQLAILTRCQHNAVNIICHKVTIAEKIHLQENAKFLRMFELCLNEKLPLTQMAHTYILLSNASWRKTRSPLCERMSEWGRAEQRLPSVPSVDLEILYMRWHTNAPTIYRVSLYLLISLVYDFPPCYFIPYLKIS